MLKLINNYIVTIYGSSYTCAYSVFLFGPLVNGLLSVVSSLCGSNILVILASGEDSSSCLLATLVTLACRGVAVATWRGPYGDCTVEHHGNNEMEELT